MLTSEALALLLDEQRISDCLNRTVRATRLRIKPEVSITCALVDQSAGEAIGWAQLLWPVSHPKAEKSRKHASRLGLAVHDYPLADGALLLHTGEVLTDPKLSPALHAPTAAAALDGWDAGQLLRYNPLRRLVVRRDDTVVRVEASPAPFAPQLHDFLAKVVATPARSFDAELPQLSIAQWTGDSDLERTPSHRGSRAAGAQVAALHAATTHLPTGLREQLPGRYGSIAAQAEAHAGILDALEPKLARRVRSVGRQLNEHFTGDAVLSHGDLTPDQVLISRADRQVWLTDFDRVCLAPSAADLGSYLALAGHSHGQAFLAGYQEAGGQLPSPRQLQLGMARARLLRLATPLRLGAANWQQRISEQIDAIEAEL